METIIIVSGEGEGPGMQEVYRGARTMRALRRRLTTERCNGDRWARAVTDEGERIHEDDGCPGDTKI